MLDVNKKYNYGDLVYLITDEFVYVFEQTEKGLEKILKSFPVIKKTYIVCMGVFSNGVQSVSIGEHKDVGRCYWLLDVFGTGRESNFVQGVFENKNEALKFYKERYTEKQIFESKELSKGLDNSKTKLLVWE